MIVVQVNMTKEGTGHWTEFLKKIKVVIGCRSHVRATYYCKKRKVSPVDKLCMNVLNAERLKQSITLKWLKENMAHL